MAACIDLNAARSSPTFPGLGSRRLVLFVLGVAGLLAAWRLQLSPAQLVRDAQWHQLGKFFAAALQPALAYEDGIVLSEGYFLWEIAMALYKTLVYTAAAITISLIGGVLFGFLGSARAWLVVDQWEGPWARWWRGAMWVGLLAVRSLMTVLRSVHEIVWAILFLQALGAEPMAAVFAIAIPYSATLGKVFSELIDEAPKETPNALRDNGATRLQVYAFALLPTVVPDLLAYLLYRFECGLRSAAVLGFFGAPTLGYYLSLSWAERHYHEVWSYLYALLALIVVFDFWSGAIRKRLTVRVAS